MDPKINLIQLFCLFGAFSLIRRPLPVKGYKWPILRNHDYWAFFIVLHILWHTASVYNGHLRGLLIHIFVAKQLTVKLSLPVYNDLRLSRLGFEHPTFRLRAERSNRLRLVIKWNLNREFSKSTALSIA